MGGSFFGTDLQRIYDAVVHHTSRTHSDAWTIALPGANLKTVAGTDLKVGLRTLSTSLLHKIFVLGTEGT